jgi:hypothetical protein
MPFSMRPFLHFPVSFLNLPLAYILGFCSLIILLLLSSGSGYAEWGVVSTNEEAGMTIYMDPDTYRRKEDLVEVWLLYDFKTPQTFRAKTFLSFKSQTEYDCTEERVRYLMTTYFLGNMGNHRVVYNEADEGKWDPVQPDSVDHTLWKVACGKQ